MSFSRALALTFVFWALLEWDHVDGHGHEAVTSLRSLLDVKSDADDAAFVKAVEESVKSLAATVLSNYRSRQGLWESRNCSTSCSVFSCETKKLDINNTKTSQCRALPFNSTLLSDEGCIWPNGNITRCSKALLSTESYVRLPGIPTALDRTKISADQQLTICYTKNLDQNFPNIYTNITGLPFDKLVWSMFGAANGVFRIYPGLELNETQCKQSFDPRKRPWYRAITGVSKQVVILLDGGVAMATGPIKDQETLFHATTTIVSQFLDTLNKDDTVNFYKFNSTGLDLTNHVKVKMPEPSNDTAVKNALQPLRAAMDSASIDLSAAQANLTAALEDLLSNDTGFDTSNPQTLKVILIFTGGKLAEGTSISMPSNSSIAQTLTGLSVRSFIYQWKNDSNTDADLQSVACSLNASYNVIDWSEYYDVNDPLSVLQSFYSYVAKIRHTNNQDKPLWVRSYGPFTEIVSGLVAVSYPVFDEDALVGVASIGVVPSVNAIKKILGNEVVQLPGPMLTCSANLTQVYIANPDFGNSSSGGLCPVDEHLPVEEYASRTCCDAQCTIPTWNPNSPVGTTNSGTKLSAGAIAGISVGGCLLLAALFCLLCFRKAILKFFGSCNECVKKEKTHTNQGIGEVVDQVTKGTSAQAVKSQEELFGKVIG